MGKVQPEEAMESSTLSTLSTTKIEINPKLREVVVELFEQMHLDHGKKFVDLWMSLDPEDLVLHWCRELVGFTPREIKRGLVAQKSLDWPPTTSEFKKLCRPSIDPEIAYHEALTQGTARECGNPNVWSSPAIFWAWRAVGAKAFRELGYAGLKKRWEKALSDELEKGAWEDIPPMVLKLDVDMKSTKISERGRAEIQKVVNQFIKKDSSQTDHLLWARRAVQRYESGDRTVPLMTLKSAREVLRIA